MLSIVNHQKGNNVGNTRSRTPKPFDSIKIHGEVPFTHTLLSTSTLRPSNTVIGGRVDYAIGRILESHAMNATLWPKRLFCSLLLLVQAKVEHGVDQALPQLIVYLASLRQSRIQRQRKDTSVYGIASDGYKFIFVKISNDGTVMLSKRYDIVIGDMMKVLACMKYLLEMTANRSPASSAEKKQCDSNEEDEYDPPLDLDDNPFTNPPSEEDDF